MSKNRSLDLDETESAASTITNPIPEEKPAKKYCTVVNCDKLRVREEPSETGEVLVIVNKDTKMVFEGKVDSTWTHVQTLTGKEGYVMSKYIKRA